MDYDPKEIEVINLLEKLKQANVAYPREMLALRRQGYIKQVTEIIAGAGLAIGLKNTIKSGGGSAGSPAAGTLIETLLVVAIIAEAAAVTYFYRDQLTDFFKTFSNEPRVEEVSQPPVMPSLVAEIESTPTPSLVPTGTGTPTSTPSAEFALEPTRQGEESSSQSVSTPGPSLSTPGSGGNSGSQPGMTPQPANTRESGNSGNQYGLTPKPDRTREPGNEASSENQNKNKP